MNSLMHSGDGGSERALATARWASPAEVVSRSFKSGDIWIGRAATVSEAPVGYADDRHVLTVAGSRSGKGASTIIPNLCLWPGSAVIIDPKGENASVVAARRACGSDDSKGMGQDVYVLDPFKTAKVSSEYRASFNPLDALDPHDPESADEAGRLADAMVVMTNEKDAFWDQRARAFIKAVILHVITAEEFEGRRNLVTVRQLVTAGDIDGKESLDDPQFEDVSAFDLLFIGMQKNPAFTSVIKRAGHEFAHMMNTAENTFSGVLANASNNTEFIDTESMARILGETTPGFTLPSLKTSKKGVSVFLCLPQRFMNTHFRWLRMMVSLLITEMEKTQGRPATGYPVLVVLDEFAGLKKMEVIENAVAQIAGAGVKLMFVVQTLTQLKAHYKDNWEAFIANTGTKLFFGVDDHFSREYVSKLLGETEIVRTTSSTSDTLGTSQSRTAGRSESDTIGTSHSHGTSSSTTHGTSSSFGGSSGFSKSSDVGLFWNTARSLGASGGGNWSRGSSSSTTHGNSENWGTSQSKTTGTSASETQGTSDSHTHGQNTAIHKRPLLTPDEVGALFARLDDETNPAFPGLALAMTGSGLPLIVRRTNYFHDPYFAGLFDPHPDHGIAAPKSLPVLPAAQAAPEPEIEVPIEPIITPLDAIDRDTIWIDEKGLRYIGKIEDFDAGHALALAFQSMDVSHDVSINGLGYPQLLMFVACEAIRTHNKSTHTLANEGRFLRNPRLGEARLEVRKAIRNVTPSSLDIKTMPSPAAKKPDSWEDYLWPFGVAMMGLALARYLGWL